MLQPFAQPSAPHILIEPVWVPSPDFLLNAAVAALTLIAVILALISTYIAYRSAVESRRAADASLKLSLRSVSPYLMIQSVYLGDAGARRAELFLKNLWHNACSESARVV
jgi:hypothetical protein